MIGSKYHGLLFAVIFCGAALSIADWRRVAFKKYYLNFVCDLIHGRSLLSSNWWVFDNPVYPFGGTLFGTSSWNERTALLYNGIAEKISNLEAVAALPWKMSFWVTDGTMNDLLGPLWLFLFPVAIIARPWPTTLQRFAVYVLLVTPLWAFSNAKVRYFAPLWLLLFWFCGWAWSYLKDSLFGYGPSVK